MNPNKQAAGSAKAKDPVRVYDSSNPNISEFIFESWHPTKFPGAVLGALVLAV